MKNGNQKNSPVWGMYTMGDNPDWHPAQVIAALHMRGETLASLARRHGYASPSTLSQALRRRWPKGERIIAQALGLHPAEIWPTRYQGGNGDR